MPTIYKIYASMLAERLREEMKGMGLIPPLNQQVLRGGWELWTVFMY